MPLIGNTASLRRKWKVVWPNPAEFRAFPIARRPGRRTAGQTGSGVQMGCKSGGNQGRRLHRSIGGWRNSAVFAPEDFVDIVGVAGSIPAAPTILFPFGFLGLETGTNVAMRWRNR